jgi:biopolymer transport protein ExbD
MNPEPELQFQPEEYASYDIGEGAEHHQGSKVTKFGFVGNEQYSRILQGGRHPSN